MGVTENKSGEEKQRLIPKLTPEAKNGDTKAETQEERMERINKVRQKRTTFNNILLPLTMFKFPATFFVNFPARF
jgi:hypothetical protein